MVKWAFLKITLPFVSPKARKKFSIDGAYQSVTFLPQLLYSLVLRQSRKEGLHRRDLKDQRKRERIDSTTPEDRTPLISIGSKGELAPLISILPQDAALTAITAFWLKTVTATSASKLLLIFNSNSAEADNA